MLTVSQVQQFWVKWNPEQATAVCHLSTEDIQKSAVGTERWSKTQDTEYQEGAEDGEQVLV